MLKPRAVRELATRTLIRISVARRVELDRAVFGFEDAAVFVADGLAFLGELSAVLLAVAENGDEATGPGQEAIDSPGSEDGAFAELRA